ncbi:DUF6600 domain-containing protein [Pedobacter nutrimenti]|uniref:YXWGXW repeat-containing protein n=1 Tax=Pedobacter nutrimenti TaxID=1241337 RepID=A0A318UHX3_9SPHI|nr:DUF6600 domain-containing protein [Pedobacter nutrimenti]PYF75683.1 hypothetical protein B0O44_102237 [Pedobacter nutrimenti]
MKRMFKLPVLVLGLLFLLTGTAQKVAAQENDVSLQTFYDELSPYGTWIQDSQYGYVWRPDVDQADFRPYYSNGRWVMTEYGNTWVSDYNWGWAPFHYGRWVLNQFNQWLWIPDTTWGPAWVSWRSGGGYYGWAPLSPGINININFGGGYHIPNSWWCFIPQSNIYYNRYPRYRSYNNVTIINNTTIINNVYRGGRNTYYTGPGRDDIRRATNQDVRVYNVSRSSRPDRTGITNNTVNIYNPRSSRSNDGRTVAPRNAISQSEYTASRGERSSRGDVTDRGNNFGNRPDRGERNPGSNTPGNNMNNTPGRSSRDQNTTPGRDFNRGDNPRPATDGTQPVRTPDNGNFNRPTRTDRGNSSGSFPQQRPQQWQRPESGQPVQPNQPAQPVQPRPDRSQRPEQPARTEQPQRWQQQPSQPQRMERPPQQQIQPQRMERPPQQQVQPQRMERSQPQQSAPARESRGEQGGGERASRSGRG